MPINLLNLEKNIIKKVELEEMLHQYLRDPKLPHHREIKEDQDEEEQGEMSPLRLLIEEEPPQFLSYQSTSFFVFRGILFQIFVVSSKFVFAGAKNAKPAKEAIAVSAAFVWTWLNLVVLVERSKPVI